MADIQDTDKFLVSRSGSSYSVDASELMAEIQDDDLMLVNRAGVSYKVTGLEVKDSLQPSDVPPSMTGATLSGTGPLFSGQTYTTTLQDYDPGVPEADQTMLAKVTGALSVAGETSAITNVASGPGQVGIYASSNLDTAPSFGSYLDKGDTTTSWNTTWDSVTYTQTGGIGGTIGFWYSDDAVTWTRDSSTVWGTSPLGSGGIGTDAKRYMAFNADVTGVPDGTDVGYVDIPDMTGLTVVSASGEVTLALTDRTDLDNGLFQPGDPLVIPGTSSLPESAVEIDIATPYNTFYANCAGDAEGDYSQIFIETDCLSGGGGVYTTDEGPFTSTGTLIARGPVFNIVFANPVANTSGLEIRYYAPNWSGGMNQGLWINGVEWTTRISGVAGGVYSNLLIDPAEIATIQSIGINGVDPNNYFGIWWVKINGNLITEITNPTVVGISESSPEMTVSGGTWSVGETVKNTVARAPEIEPVTDEITGFAEGIAYASTWFTDGTAVNDPGDANNTWDKAFNGTQTSLSDGIYGNPGIEYTFDKPMVGEWVFDVYLGTGVNTGTQDLIRLDDYQVNGDDPGWVTFGESQYGRLNWTGTVNKITLPIGSMYLNKVSFNSAFLIVGNAPAGSVPDVLTFASDKDLANFNALDDVTQSSGYQPITSAITNVATDSVTKVKAYYSADRPNNLAEAITGTEYDLTLVGTNVVENSHYLALVCEDGCPTSGQVFKTDAGPIFDMKYSGGGGNFSADGTQLDAASNPPSGPSTTTEVLFSDGGTTGYIVNTQAAYTLIKTINLGTLPEVVDAAQGEESVLTLTDDTDLANFRVGDAISIPDASPQTADVKFAITSPYQDNGDYYLRSGYTDNGGGEEAPFGTYTDVISVTDAGVLSLNARAYGNVGPVTIELVNATTSDPLIYSGASSELICPSTVTFGAGGGSMKITWKKTVNLSDHVIYYLYFSGQANSTWQGGIISGGKTYEAVSAVTGAVLAIGPGNTLTLSKAGFSVGETVTGPATTPATGTVASTDPAAKTMTLSASDESGTKRWIVNAGKTVVGPTGPATRFDAFLTWTGNQVTGISTTDPGYFQAPPDLQLQFTDPAPTGNPWDVELPAGTTIQTRVKATNASGEADSGWTNVVTPRLLQSGDALSDTFAETSLRMATFDNRAEVNEGNVAMQQRSALATQLVADGYDQAEVDLMLPVT